MNSSSVLALSNCLAHSHPDTPLVFFSCVLCLKRSPNSSHGEEGPVEEGPNNGQTDLDSKAMRDGTNPGSQAQCQWSYIAVSDEVADGDHAQQQAGGDQGELRTTWSFMVGIEGCNICPCWNQQHPRGEVHWWAQFIRGKDSLQGHRTSLQKDIYLAFGEGPMHDPSEIFNQVGSSGLGQVQTLQLIIGSENDTSEWTSMSCIFAATKQLLSIHHISYCFLF